MQKIYLTTYSHKMLCQLQRIKNNLKQNLQRVKAREYI